MTTQDAIINQAIRFKQDDGGRAEAGYQGVTGDCVTRSIAIATGKPYQEVYSALSEGCRTRKLKKHRKASARNGVSRVVYEKYLKAQGWRFIATMGIGTGCRVHLRASEVPKGRVIVRLSRHLAAVIDGTLHDTYDCSRDGTRCIYGYFTNAL